MDNESIGKFLKNPNKHFISKICILTLYLYKFKLWMCMPFLLLNNYFHADSPTKLIISYISFYKMRRKSSFSRTLWRTSKNKFIYKRCSESTVVFCPQINMRFGEIKNKKFVRKFVVGVPKK